MLLSRRTPVRFLVAALVAAVVGGVFLAPTHARADAGAGSIHVLGGVPLPPGTTTPFNTFATVPGRHRMIALVEDAFTFKYEFADYDTSNPVPHLRRVVPAPGLEADFGPWQGGAGVSVDEDHGLIYFLGYPNGPGVNLQVIDLATLRVLKTIDLNPAAPGFIGYGLTYSPKDRKIYVVGDFAGHSNLSLLGFAGVYGLRPAGVSAVLALNLDGSRAWLRVIPQCRQPLVSVQVGTLVARSEDQDALYFGCMRTFAYPGLAGVIRLRVNKDLDQGAALQTRLDFFPISGHWTQSSGLWGLAAWDPATDRFAVSSGSRATFGAWIFDGRLSAWVGHVSTTSFPGGIGFNRVTGHLTLLHRTSGNSSVDPSSIEVADARATPPSQGQVFLLPVAQSYSTNPDPDSNRFFVPTADLAEAHLGKGPGLMVVADDTPNAVPPEPVAYDDLTRDIPEGPQTITTFAGTVNGFGARSFLVGGYRAALSPAESGFGGLPQVDSNTDKTGFSPGDRGAFASRAPVVDLRNIGSTVTTQALVTDPLTSDDIASRQQTVAGAVGTGATTAAGKDLGGQLATAADQSTSWPYTPASCLDAGGGKAPAPVESAQQGGSASAACDLGNYTATGSTSFGAVSVDTPGAPNVHVASTSFDSKVSKAPAGIVTETTARAHGIRIDVPGAGSLRLGDILAVAKTVADGHPGGASTTYTRTIDHASLYDATGALLTSCSEQCDPVTLVDEANQLFESQVRLELPKPDLRSTPRGAFAGIEKNDTDYYNGLTTNNDNSRAVPALDLVLINDGVERSRVQVQFAAIQASSIYGIAPLPTETHVEGRRYENTPPPLGPGTRIIGSPPAGGQQDAGGSGTGGFVEQVVRSALFLVRSPGQALLFAMAWLLFGGAIGAFMRRRRLMELMEGDN